MLLHTEHQMGVLTDAIEHCPKRSREPWKRLRRKHDDLPIGGKAQRTPCVVPIVGGIDDRIESRRTGDPDAIGGVCTVNR